MEYLKHTLPLKPFILVRHAQTHANVEKIACGRLDSPLTPLGQEQACNLACKLKSFSNSNRPLLHTGLIRSKETVQIIADSIGGNLIAIPDLAEHSFGELEGQPWQLVFALLEKGFTPPGGESRLEFIERTMRALSKVIEDFDQPIIVAHGGTFFAIAYSYGFLSRDVGNCEALCFTPRENDEFPWQTRLITGDHPWQIYDLITKRWNLK